MNFNEFAQKKVLGVPILYVIGAAVVIFAVVAWKLKPSAGSSQAEEAPADAADTGGDLPDPYDEFETKGTVIVNPNPVPNPDQDLANQGIQTNTEWLTKGTQYLITEKNATGTAAASALTKYINGQDRSFDEDMWVNAVIKEFGLPPDGADIGSGSVGGKPATKQFTGAGTHTVQGTSDNTASALAGLYYNSNAQDRIDLIEAANLSKGLGPYPTGAQIAIPEYRVPKYYTTPKSGYLFAGNVAINNGISLETLAALNNPKGGAYARDYKFAPGTRLRVA